VAVVVTQAVDGGRPDNTKRPEVNLCVILRRIGWPTPDARRAAGGGPGGRSRRATATRRTQPGLIVVAHDAALTVR